MMVERISCSRTKYISHDVNECIEVSAIVNSNNEQEKNESLASLQAWTEDRLQIRETVAKLYNRKERLQAEIQSLEFDVEKAKAKWEAVKGFLEKVNISVVDDIPF